MSITSLLSSISHQANSLFRYSTDVEHLQGMPRPPDAAKLGDSAAVFGKTMAQAAKSFIRSTEPNASGQRRSFGAAIGAFSRTQDAANVRLAAHHLGDDALDGVHRVVHFARNVGIDNASRDISRAAARSEVPLLDASLARRGLLNYQSPSTGRSALFQAAVAPRTQRSDEMQSRLLMARDRHGNFADLNLRDQFENTCLHAAAMSGNVPFINAVTAMVARQGIDRAPDLDLRNNRGQTCFDLAARNPALLAALDNLVGTCIMNGQRHPE